MREMPGDEEVGRAMFEAQIQLKKERGEDVEDMNFGGHVILVTTNDRFRHFVTAPGIVSFFLSFIINVIVAAFFTCESENF